MDKHNSETINPEMKTVAGEEENGKFPKNGSKKEDKSVNKNSNGKQEASKDAETSKDSKASKHAETSKDSKASKHVETSKDSKASKDAETSKDSKDAETSKDSKASKHVETSKDSKASKHVETSKDSKASKHVETSKDSKASKDAETSKDSKASKDAETSKDSKASKDAETSKDSKASKDAETSKDSNASKDVETSKDSKASKDAETSKDSKASKDAETSKDSKASKDAETSKDSKASKDAETSKDSKASKDAETSKDSNASIDAETSKDSNASIDAEESKDSEASKDAEGSKDSEASKDAEGSKESEASKDAEGSKESEASKDTEVDSQNNKSSDKKDTDSASDDKMTIKDGSEILVTFDEEKSSEQKENKSNKSSLSTTEDKKDKTVIKLTEEDDEDDVQFLSEGNVGHSREAVEINLAENSLRDIEKQSNIASNKNGQMNSAKQNNSLLNNYGGMNSKTPTYSGNTPGNSSLNKSGYASCSSSSPFSPNLNDTDDARDMAPTSSTQQIEVIKRETLLHSMSVKMQRILKERAKAELLKKVDEPLGPLATFLNNLGLDIVKQSVYQEAIHIQSRKQQASKLSEIETSQLDKMRSSCKELSVKLHHLKLNYRKCKLCNFVSESVNVHFWHREHPHINKREDLCCSYCDFLTRNNAAFNFHMEAEHNIRGRSMDKPSFWQCTLCPFEHNSKTKLTQHKFKCEKIFELKTHLAPSPETDINYSLYGVFYLSEKEETLKAIALHKAKQAQIKAQQAQYKLQQLQVATNRANYFNANKLSPMQQHNQGNMNQRYPVMSHNKPHGSGMQSPNQMQGNQARSNCYQHPSHNRSSMVRPTTPTIKQFTLGRGNVVQNHYRGSPMSNQGMNNSNLMHSRLPVKDLIKTQNMMPNRSLGNQKYMPNSDVSSFETCELCNGYVKDRNALRIHLFYAHKVEMPALMFEKPNPPLFCDVCDRKFWTSQGLQKHRVLLKHYAKGSLSQVCIVCGCQVTHLLNHMTNTHQINLQDFLNQKRCIVCGIVCQSRSGTEIHMASSHGILVKHSNTNSYETTKKSPTTPYNVPGKTGYTTPSPTQSKGHYCMFCKVPFPTSMELNRHRLLAHKSCPRCSMVLPNAQALTHHKCQMRVLTKKVCKVCKQQVPLSNFIRHVQERHLKRVKVSLKRVSSEQIKSGIKEKIIHVDLTDEPSSPLSQDGDDTSKDVPSNFTLPKQKFDPLRMKRKRPLDPEDYYPNMNSNKSGSKTSDGKMDSGNDVKNKRNEAKSGARSMDERRRRQREAARKRQRRRREKFTEDERQAQRNRNREQMRRTRNQMSEEERNAYNNRSRELMQTKMSQMNEEEKVLHNAQARELMRTRRDAMDEEERQARRSINRERMKARRDAMDEEARRAQRSINREKMRIRRNYMTEEERLMDLENRRNRNKIETNNADHFV